MENLVLPVCGFPDCGNVAVGGRCDFSLYCVIRGCGRNLCRAHRPGFDAAVYADPNSGRMCVECEPRARIGKVILITLFILLLLALTGFLATKLVATQARNAELNAP